MMKKFLIEIGRRYDWRPKNEREFWIQVVTIALLGGLAIGYLIGSIVTELALAN